ncbi:hypothetical protein Pan258_17400 [Symmachiella dynata]|nr:hypothetical protein Pan258_17400 [Symmachiella dynata]
MSIAANELDSSLKFSGEAVAQLSTLGGLTAQWERTGWQENRFADVTYRRVGRLRLDQFQSGLLLEFLQPLTHETGIGS